MSGAGPASWTEWRREQRQRLLAARNALPSAARHALSDRVIANLDRAVRDLSVTTLGLYWPIKREIDLLQWAGALSRERNIALALPVITAPRQPLAYCLWQPGAPLTPGVWSIPEPAEKRPVVPEVVIAPLVGFSGCWRLGYGGGYFDRTLAARDPAPIAIGIGFDAGELPDFAPQNHDVAMKLIVTESRIIKQRLAGTRPK